MSKLLRNIELNLHKIGSLIYYYTLVSKLKSPLIIVSLILASIFFAFVGTSLGLKFTLFIFGSISAACFLFLIYVSPKIGFFTAFVLPFVLFITERRFGIEIPFGTGIQVILFTTLVIILFKKASVRDYGFSFLQNNVTWIFLVLIIYNLFQGLNPNLDSLTGWYIVVKGNAGLLCTYIVGLYLAKDRKFLKQFLLIWIIMAFICALYACYQEWFGLANFEKNWIHADKLRFNRIFVKGRYRIFSLLSDPAAFGIFMSASALITFIIATKPMRFFYKLLLLIAAAFMFMAMGYSGTRTAYAMVPAGLLMFGFLTITNQKTLLFALLGAMVFIFILFGPIHGNATINRVRTTFNPEDASLNIRDVNRQSIQPYIYDNPMGGGVMTTGDAGLKYNPNHPLAGFPPDSGYLKLALETGWIGLLLYMLFLFIGLKEGIASYFKCKDPLVKHYYLAFLVFVFSITIALYAQTVTTQIPISLLFWPVMGILGSMKKLDKINS